MNVSQCWHLIPPFSSAPFPGFGSSFPSLYFPIERGGFPLVFGESFGRMSQSGKETTGCSLSNVSVCVCKGRRAISLF